MLGSGLVLVRLTDRVRARVKVSMMARVTVRVKGTVRVRVCQRQSVAYGYRQG